MPNLPNTLTLARIACIPLIGAAFFLEKEWTTVSFMITWYIFGLFVVCALTDFLDGALARKLNQVTALGTFLDPISDKILVSSLLIFLVAFGRITDVWIIPVTLILAREFAISGLREYLGPKNIALPVTTLAKWKTTLQMGALALYILNPVMPFTIELAQGALLSACFVTLVTGAQYIRAGWKSLSP